MRATCLARLEATLTRGPYLAGERVSAADVVWFPSVQLVMRAAKRAGLPIDPTPAVAAWSARLEAVPGCDD